MKLTRLTFSRMALRLTQRMCLWYSWTTCLRTESFLKPFGLQDLRIFLRPIFFSGCDEKLSVFEQSPHNWLFEDGHHRIHSECGPCYIEHGLREHSSACQEMSGDWRGKLWTLLVTFCIIIIRCTETFWSTCSSGWWGFIQLSLCPLPQFCVTQFPTRRSGSLLNSPYEVEKCLLACCMYT
jgi:hypothetical protein